MEKIECYFIPNANEKRIKNILSVFLKLVPERKLMFFVRALVINDLGQRPVCYPLITAMGRILAIFFEIPDECTTSMTWEISL